MNSKQNEKRVIKGYKVRNSIYQRAKKRGGKEGKPLSQLLEKVVDLYAHGYNIAFYDKTIEFASKID